MDLLEPTLTLRAALLGLALLGAGPGLAAPARPASACQAVQARPGQLVSVPFDTVDGRIYVSARVNGLGPFRFAVDTGASGMGRADASLMRELALPPAGTGRSSDGIRTAEVDQVRFTSVSLGGLTRRDLTVISRDYRSRLRPEAMFAGILGREFFGDGLLVIDYPNRRLTFTRQQALHPGMVDVVGYERAFRLPVTIGGTATTGNIDTGANVAYVMPRALYEATSREPLRPGPDGQLMNSTIRSERGQLTQPPMIGSAHLPAGEVRVSDQFPELLIGAHALQAHAILIDQRRNLVALCPAG
jgi:hypothetical protein